MCTHSAIDGLHRDGIDDGVYQRQIYELSIVMLLKAIIHIKGSRDAAWTAPCQTIRGAAKQGTSLRLHTSESELLVDDDGLGAFGGDDHESGLIVNAMLAGTDGMLGLHDGCLDAALHAKVCW